MAFPCPPYIFPRAEFNPLIEFARTNILEYIFVNAADIFATSIKGSFILWRG